MTRMIWILISVASVVHSKSSIAQTNLTVPGGATGANVYCLLAGSLTSGVIAATFLQTKGGTWEQRSKAGTFRLKEKARDDLTVELQDSSGSITMQFDFVTQLIRERLSSSLSSSTAKWVDQYVILNATDQESSEDCVSFATRNAAVSPKDDGAEEPVVTDGERSNDDLGKKAKKPSSQRKKANKPSSQRKKAEKPPNARNAKKSSNSGASSNKGKDCFPIFQPYGGVEQRCK